MCTDSEPLREGLAAMSRFFFSDATLRETLQKVSDLAATAVASADVVGITMLVDGRARTAVFTDDIAREVDAAQYESDSGPCLDAFRNRQVYRIRDTHSDGQWVQFSQRAAEHGLRSAMAIPLLARHEGVGALNFYSRVVDGFSDRDVETGVQFATHAAVVVANSQAYWHAYQLGQEMGETVKFRATIEQAKGIVMGTHHCSAAKAWEILSRAVQRDGRALREVAEELVTRTARGGPNMEKLLGAASRR